VPRRSFDITKESAANVAAWRVAQIAKDPATPIMRRVGLQAAISQGYLTEIFDEVYGLGFKISADENDPLHVKMLAAGSIVRDANGA
jgi:hypothetical protein